jgi:mutator protein MutT
MTSRGVHGPTDAVPLVRVGAAVIERDGRFLVTRRLVGTHLAGYWEFPGGKCHEGEALGACLEREIREELDAAIEVGREILSTSHAYPERVVELHFFECVLTTSIRPALGQEILWVVPKDLPDLRLPPADAELVEILSTRRPAGSD